MAGKAAVSSSNTRSDRSWPWLTGARESVSAMGRSLPGTWDIEYVKHIRRRRNLWIRIGNSSRHFFEVSRGTRGLWSVSIWNCIPASNPKIVHKPK